MDDSLLEGAVKFMEDGFLEHEELFKSLQHKQRPAHTFYILCGLKSCAKFDNKLPARRAFYGAKYRKYRAAI